MCEQDCENKKLVITKFSIFLQTQNSKFRLFDMRKHSEMQTAKSRSIFAKLGDGRRRCDTNKSFHPFAPLEVTLAFIDPLITLKLFYRRSQLTQ